MNNNSHLGKAFSCEVFAWKHSSTLQWHFLHETLSVMMTSLIGLWFQLWPKLPNPRFINSNNSMQECFIFNIESSFQQGSNVQAFQQWGTHHTEILLFFKSLVKIWNTDTARTPVALESSLHVARQSSWRASATRITLLSSADVLVFPGLCAHTTTTKMISLTRKPYYGPLELTSKCHGFLWNFCRVKFRSQCITSELK